MRLTLAVQRDAVGSAVEGHVERSRSGRNGVNRAAAGACRELNYVLKGRTHNSYSFILSLNRAAK